MIFFPLIVLTILNEIPKKASKRLWSFIKIQQNENSGVSPLRQNGVLASDTKEKAEILNKQFCSVFTKETSDSPVLPDCPYQKMSDIHVTQSGVLALLKNLNPSKAQGPDLLHPKLLKELSNEISPILTSIFNHSLQSGEVPEDWRKGNIVPIFKKGDKHKPSNYRPVSLTSICSKLIEHILVSNIRKHLDTNNILVDEQHGFRPKRSCESQLLTFTQFLLTKYPMVAKSMLWCLTSAKPLTRSPTSASWKNFITTASRGQHIHGSKLSCQVAHSK